MNTPSVSPTLLASSIRGTGQPTSQEASISSDFETFLKMLTGQIKNQDPLKPMDSSEFATQLATFSSLEQQVLTNDRLKQISIILGSQGLTQHADWIGKKGLVDGPFDLNGSDAVLKFVIPPSAQTPKLIIQNGLGEIVFEKFMSPGDNEFTLKAKDQTGIPLHNGPFTATIIEADDAKTASISKVGSYHEIVEVQQINGTSYIHFENGKSGPLTKSKP
jgi:flagellar basal-body rod modification protein FlgD